MKEDRTVYRSMAIRDGWISAVYSDPHGLDSLAVDRASVIEASQLTLLPAFDDSHNHLIQQAKGMSQVQPDGAHSIAELLDRIRQRSAQTSSGGWIRTSTTWNESNLAEKRLPTAAEIDQATTDHPVWIRRGGHIGSANSLALKLAGFTQETPDPQFGQILRHIDGTPTGILVAGPAMNLVESLIPPAPFEQHHITQGTVQDRIADIQTSRSFLIFIF